jgi:hypothetical protein
MAAFEEQQAYLDDPSLTADLLQIFVALQPPSEDGDVFFSTRASASDAWPELQPLTEINTEYQENTPRISRDGLTLWLASDRPGCVGDEDLWVTTREDVNSAFRVPICVTALNSAQLENSPGLTFDHLQLAFTSWRSPGGVGNGELLLTKRTSPLGAWSAPEPLSVLNSSADDADVSFALNGLLIVFASERLGTRDFFSATRPNPGAPFTDPVLIDSLSTNEDEEDLWLSEDARYAVFVRAKNQVRTLYEARR